MTSATCIFCDGVIELGVTDIWSPCAHCEAMVFRETQGPSVVIAHESLTLTEKFGRSLVENGLQPVHVTEARHCLKAMQRATAEALIIDVSLGVVGTPGIIDAIQAHESLANTFIVLVASVFNPRAYQRRATNLYGANAYIDASDADKVGDMVLRELRAL